MKFCIPFHTWVLLLDITLLGCCGVVRPFVSIDLVVTIVEYSILSCCRYCTVLYKYL